MIDFIQAYSPITQTLMATLFTWGVTAAGASLVFFTKTVTPKLMDSMLGFAAGVMIAASFWSLLAPGIEMAEQLGHLPWLTAVIGFMGGGIFMRLADRLLPHLHLGLDIGQSEGLKTSWQRSTLLVLAITLHNIPEGLAVGVAFGAVAANLSSATLGGAIAASLVIAITSFVLPLARQQGPELESQTLALHQVTRVALALDSREELMGATITLRLPDNVELKGFPGQRMISWKTNIDRGTNLLALPVKGIIAKNGLLVARLEYGNKSKEYKVELTVQNQDVDSRLDRKGTFIVSQSGYALSIDRKFGKEGNA
mgnify:CR=1 FL=1